MPGTARRKTPPESVGGSAPLATLADVAARLASDAPLDETVPAVIDRLCGLLEAADCALWLNEAGGLVRRWGTAAADTAGSVGVAAVEAALGRADGDEAGADGLIVRRLRVGSRDLGALVARASRPLQPAERLAFDTTGDLLAPIITHAELSRRLSFEVEARTREIDEQRRFTERIIDSLPLGVYVIDREYRICAWNRKRETGMQGVSREEAIGRTIFEILHRQPAEVLRSEFDDVFETGILQQIITESRATGEVRTFRITKVPMRLDEARVTHVITIGEDITEWKGAEARFAQAEKLAAIGQLAAGVMHEINNPLATIAACAESLTMRMDEMRSGGADIPSDGPEYLKIIDNEVHRCKRIIDGLLDFSRPRRATKMALDLNYVVEETLFLLKHHTRFKKLEVRTEYDRTLKDPVLGSREQLIQVVMALLLNALDAMDERGTIVIRTGPRADGQRGVQVEIKDEGHGIPRSEMTKIFEPFYTTKPPGRGTGLGLSICYGIVAEHGGRIEVDSAPRKGSTFRILLPAADAAALAAALAAETAADATPPDGADVVPDDTGATEPS